MNEGQRSRSEAELTAGVSCHLPHLQLGAAAVVGDDAPVEAPPPQSIRWFQVRRARFYLAAPEAEVLCSPGSWDVGQVADWAVAEASVENSEVPPCTQTLNTSGAHRLVM